MKRLIRKILREEINRSDKYYRFLDKISSIIEKPYIKNMYERFNGGFWDITDRDDQGYIIRNIFGGDITIDYLNGDIFIYNTYDEIIYSENPIGYWRKRVYDNGNLIYDEDSDGNWEKWVYDNNGNKIYKESSDGSWVKWEFDDKGNEIYYEDSSGDIWDIR